MVKQRGNVTGMGGINQELRMTNKDLLRSIGNSIQYSVTTYMRKKKIWKRMNIRITESLLLYT